jgi:endonuclease YncB( thermonuclease family)
MLVGHPKCCKKRPDERSSARRALEGRGNEYCPALKHRSQSWLDDLEGQRMASGHSGFSLAATSNAAYLRIMRRLAPVLLLIPLTLALGPAADFPAKVVGISDGDTLTVLTTDKTHVKIRLHGFDAPETGQDFAARSKQASSELASGKAVTVRPARS